MITACDYIPKSIIAFVMYLHQLGANYKHFLHSRTSFTFLFFVLQHLPFLRTDKQWLKDACDVIWHASTHPNQIKGAGWKHQRRPVWLGRMKRPTSREILAGWEYTNPAPCSSCRPPAALKSADAFCGMCYISAAYEWSCFLLFFLKG